MTDRFYSNCLIWALWRFFRLGGWVKMRWSYWGPFPHFSWSQDDKVYRAFSPVSPRKRIIPPPIFLGHVVEE